MTMGYRDGRVVVIVWSVGWERGGDEMGVVIMGWSLWGVMKGDGDSGVGMVEMGAVITLVLHKGVAGWSTEGVFKEELAVIYIT